MYLIMNTCIILTVASFRRVFKDAGANLGVTRTVDFVVEVQMFEIVDCTACLLEGLPL